jgi:hypothetical protein
MKSLRAVLALALAAPSPLSAQQRTPAPGDVSTTVRVEVVQLDVLAVDGKDRPVFDMKQDEFDVRIAGKPQPLEAFEPPAQPASPGAPVPAPELLGGSTRPVTAGGAPALHVLFVVDEEELPRSGIKTSAKEALEFARAASGARIGLVTHFGHSATRLWDENSTERLDGELQAAVDEPVGDSGMKVDRGALVDSDRESVSAEREYDKRLRKEAALVEEILRAEDPTGARQDLRLIQSAYRQFNLYLASERQRVADTVTDLQGTLARFAALGDRRHAILFSRGIERIPGASLVQYLSSARQDRSRSRGGPPKQPDMGRNPRQFEGETPADLNGYVIWDGSPLREMDDLAGFLASSGVTLHVVDPSAGADMAGAEHGYVGAIRDRANDRRELNDGASRLVSVTGGLMRMSQGAIADLADTLQASYRLAVRVTGVEPQKTYKVSVTSRRKGVRVLARSAFRPSTATAGKHAVERVEDAVKAAMHDERRPGAARLAPRTIPLKLLWKGKKKDFYELEVKVPYDALGFVPEEDSMVASARITVTPLALGAATADPVTEDVFLALTGAEYSGTKGQDLTRVIKMPLPPGRYQLTVTIEDALLEKSAGLERITVEASP